MKETKDLVSDIELNPELQDIDPQTLKEMMWFMDFLEALIVIEGRKGSGKTCGSVAIAWKLKELFNRPVICDFHPTDEFGEYTFLDEKKFLKHLSDITDVAKNTAQEDIDLAVEWSLRKLGIQLSESTIILDESYRYFDCRTPTDKLVRIFGYFIAQSRHYRNTIILLTPNKLMLDRRVRQQVDFYGRVAFNARTQVIHGRFTNQMTGDVKPLRIFGPNYFGKYRSWSPIAMRKSILNIGNL